MAPKGWYQRLSLLRLRKRAVVVIVFTEHAHAFHPLRHRFFSYARYHPPQIESGIASLRIKHEIVLEQPLLVQSLLLITSEKTTVQSKMTGRSAHALHSDQQISSFGDNRDRVNARSDPGFGAPTKRRVRTAENENANRQRRAQPFHTNSHPLLIAWTDSRATYRIHRHIRRLIGRTFRSFKPGAIRKVRISPN